MGFIDESVLAAHGAEMIRRTREADAREQTTKDWIEGCLQRQRRAVEEFCSPESLDAITKAVQNDVRDKFVQIGVVSRVYVAYPISADVVSNDRCADALLQHLQAVDPAVRRVRLCRNPDFLTGERYAGGCIVVHFSPALTIPLAPPA